MSDIPNLLERYGKGADLIQEAISGASDTELDFKVAPDKWSARQIVAHLADTEAVTVIRFRQLLSEEDVNFFAWNQNAWADGTDYARRDPARAIATMRTLRADNCDLLRNSPEEAFSRAGNHARYGRMSVRDLLELFTKHAEKHADQIKNARAAYRASQQIKL